jgi:hypothetical protein
MFIFYSFCNSDDLHVDEKLQRSNIYISRFIYVLVLQMYSTIFCLFCHKL